MSEPQAFLYNTYLVMGEYDAKTGKVVPKTLAPVTNRFFTRLNHKEQTLIATDDRGMLCSVNSKGELLQRINDANTGPLNLNPVPPGLARQAEEADRARPNRRPLGSASADTGDVYVRRSAGAGRRRRKGGV
jgi:hypothetical protein